MQMGDSDSDAEQPQPQQYAPTQLVRSDSEGSEQAVEPPQPEKLVPQRAWAKEALTGFDTDWLCRTLQVEDIAFKLPVA
jgi:hypothetical protein